MIRAKFTVQSVTKHAYGGEEVKLCPVYGSGDNKSNAEWAKATPSGSLTMTIDNPGAQGKLVPGKEYFLDFTPAEG